MQKQTEMLSCNGIASSLFCFLGVCGCLPETKISLPIFFLNSKPQSPLHEGLQIPTIVSVLTRHHPSFVLNVTGPAGKQRVIPGSCFQGCDTSLQTRFTKPPSGGWDNTEERAWQDCKVMNLLIKWIFRTGCSLRHTHTHTHKHARICKMEKHSPYGMQVQHRWPVNSYPPLHVKQLMGDRWFK